MTKKLQVVPEKPDLAQDDAVRVFEEGIEPWTGIVLSLKPSAVSGWWITVRSDEDGRAWQVCTTNGTSVTKIEEES